jgi:hypothetical protein
MPNHYRQTITPGPQKKGPKPKKVPATMGDTWGQLGIKPVPPVVSGSPGAMENFLRGLEKKEVKNTFRF